MSGTRAQGDSHGGWKEFLPLCKQKITLSLWHAKRAKDQANIKDQEVDSQNVETRWLVKRSHGPKFRSPTNCRPLQTLKFRIARAKHQDALKLAQSSPQKIRGSCCPSSSLRLGCSYIGRLTVSSCFEWIMACQKIVEYCKSLW